MRGRDWLLGRNEVIGIVIILLLVPVMFVRSGRHLIENLHSLPMDGRWDVMSCAPAGVARNSRNVTLETCRS